MKKFNENGYPYPNNNQTEQHQSQERVKKGQEEKKKREEAAALSNVPSFLIKTYDIVNVSGE